MKRVSIDTVYLEAGETIPVLCKCGWAYKPEPLSEDSVCPCCNSLNTHDEDSQLELVE